MLNFCGNQYLGLSNHPALVAAAHAALDSHGFGVASVRFICGTQAGRGDGFGVRFGVRMGGGGFKGGVAGTAQRMPRTMTGRVGSVGRG